MDFFFALFLLKGLGGVLLNCWSNLRISLYKHTGYRAVLSVLEFWEFSFPYIQNVCAIKDPETFASFIQARHVVPLSYDETDLCLSECKNTCIYSMIENNFHYVKKFAWCMKFFTIAREFNNFTCKRTCITKYTNPSNSHCIWLSAFIDILITRAAYLRGNAFWTRVTYM